MLLYIAEIEEIVGIKKSDLRISIHPLVDDVHLHATELVADRELESLVEVALERCAVSVGSAGITHDHRIVALLVSVEGDR
jgi:hypothetical protein